MNRNTIIEREIQIAASPETIFAFFTDPSKLICWKGIKATLDPQPGGVYRLDINGRDIAAGHFIEIVPYSRLVFTWGWEGDDSTLPPGASIVEITLTLEGSHTVVRLKHTGLNEYHYQHQAQGWDFFLPRLVTAAQGGQPGSYLPGN